MVGIGGEIAVGGEDFKVRQVGGGQISSAESHDIAAFDGNRGGERNSFVPFNWLGQLGALGDVAVAGICKTAIGQLVISFGVGLIDVSTALSHRCDFRL